MYVYRYKLTKIYTTAAVSLLLRQFCFVAFIVADILRFMIYYSIDFNTILFNVLERAWASKKYLYTYTYM